MKRQFFIWTMICLLILTACTEDAAEESLPLTVFAAASLTDAFTEMGAAFEAENEGTTVTFNFAGSQQLAQQLVQGAPGDVFASANEKQMAVVVTNGRIDPDAPQIFTQNRLVVIFPAPNPANLTQLADLARPGVRLILAANEVPVGQYSLTFLEKADAVGHFGPDYKARVLANVVSYEQNVRTVFTKVALGEADAGIVYSSDIVGTDGDEVGQLTIPDALNTVGRYPIAPLANSSQPDRAQAFVNFVRSPAGQEILARYGFQPVETP